MEVYESEFGGSLKQLELVPFLSDIDMFVFMDDGMTAHVILPHWLTRVLKSPSGVKREWNCSGKIPPSRASLLLTMTDLMIFTFTYYLHCSLKSYLR